MESTLSPQFDFSVARVIVSADAVAFGLSRLFAFETPRAADQYMVVKEMTDAGEILKVGKDELARDLADSSMFKIPKV